MAFSENFRDIDRNHIWEHCRMDETDNSGRKIKTSFEKFKEMQK
jgi:hypothetical protein